jgi:hypothetical protein
MREVFAAINSLPFCRGDNDRGWRANFDWAMKPSNIAKVLEGNYGGAPGGAQTVGLAETVAGGPSVPSAAATREMLRTLEAV